MKKFNETYVIGIDHGYGNMKTANCCFPTAMPCIGEVFAPSLIRMQEKLKIKWNRVTI